MTRASMHFRAGTHRRGEDTRRRIVEAAIELFAVHEYEGTSTRMLAEQADVNLPAIQYYFGSKEGLYRAAVGYIIDRIEERISPIADGVRAALARGDLTHAEILQELCGMLDAFVALVASGDQPESWRRLLARAEIESSDALRLLHESRMRHIFGPCQALIAKLLARPEEDETIILHTLATLGQVTIFCSNGARHAFGNQLSEDRIRAIQAVVREHTAAIFHATRDSMS